MAALCEYPMWPGFGKRLHWHQGLDSARLGAPTMSTMSVISLSSDTLSVRFTRAEKLAGLLRDVDVPVGQISSVAFVADGLTAARGVRAPGLGVPTRRKIGTWRWGRGSKTLVDVRRGQPALQIALRDHRYAQLLIGTPDAALLADRVNAVLPGQSSTS